MDSNPGLLVSEVTALPTVLQQLPRNRDRKQFLKYRSYAML